MLLLIGAVTLSLVGANEGIGLPPSGPPSLHPSPAPPPWFYGQRCSNGTKNWPGGCRACPAGKYSVASKGDGFQTRTCQSCPYGTIQPLPGKDACLPCPPSGVLCETKTSIDVKRGYYMEEHSTIPSRCPNPNACLGGTLAGPASCANGTEGPFCAQCSRGWHEGIQGCESCTNEGSTLTGIVVLVVVVVFGLYGLQRYLRSQLPPRMTPQHDGWQRAMAWYQLYAFPMLRSWMRLLSWPRRLLAAAGTLARLVRNRLPATAARQAVTIAKVLISYLQVLDVFARFSHVHWPSVFVAFLKALNLSALLGIKVWVGDLLLPFQCALSLPIDFYTQLVITLTLPIAISAIVFSVATIVTKLSGRTAAERADLFRSPAVMNVHLWTILLLYPSICRLTLAAFQCTPLCHTPELPTARSDDECDGGEVTQVLFPDPSVVCYQPRWFAWAAVALVGIVVYCLGAPLAFLRLTSKYRSSPDGRARISLLLNSYTPECWYFESVDMLRKLLLTSVVTVVDPNTMVQLWFGLIVSIAFVVVTVLLRPYRDLLPGLVQVAALLQVAFNFCSATLFFSDSPMASAPSQRIGVLLVLMNTSAFLILFAVVAMSMRTQQRVLSELKLVDASGLPITIDAPNVQGGYHLFLSHMWKWGQDQSGTLKSLLQTLMPQLRCFLDVDNLKDIGQLEQHVRESEVVLIMLTQGYVSSFNCRRELKEAVRAQKKLIVLWETDPNHGALTLYDLKGEVELLPEQSDRDAANVLIRMIESGEALEWHRESHLKRAVLSSIFQTIIDVQHSSCAHEGGGGGHGCHHTVPIVQVTSATASRQPNASRASIGQATVRVHLLEEYEKAHPKLYAQVADKLQLTNVEVLSSHEEGVPIVVLLSPEILRDATLRGRFEALLRADEDGLMADSIYLYSTAVPFDYYLKHCPPALKDLGLFSHMYDKFPGSLLLQKAAANLAADRLRDSSGGPGAEGQAGRGMTLPCFRAALQWAGGASPRRAQRDDEMPSRRLLSDSVRAPPPRSRKGPGVAAPPSGKLDILSAKGREERSSMRERANTEDV
jgi:hypothetical protein